MAILKDFDKSLVYHASGVAVVAAAAAAAAENFLELNFARPLLVVAREHSLIVERLAPLLLMVVSA
jgi:hypothetical protein